jgi:hypothetical protein
VDFADTNNVVDFQTYLLEQTLMGKKGPFCKVLNDGMVGLHICFSWIEINLPEVLMPDITKFEFFSAIDFLSGSFGANYL